MTEEQKLIIKQHASMIMAPSMPYTKRALQAQRPHDNSGLFRGFRRASKAIVNKAGGLQEMDIDVPRIDKQGAFIYEGSSTNLLLWSEDLSQAYYIKNGCSVALETGVSPMNEDSYFVKEDNSNGEHKLTITRNFATTGQQTFSVFLKKRQRTIVELRVSGAAFSTTISSKVNLDSGAIISGSAFIRLTTDNGYHRVVLPINVNSVNTGNIEVVICDDNENTSYIGNNVSGIYAWGFELNPVASISILNHVRSLSGSSTTKTFDDSFESYNLLTTKILNANEGMFLVYWDKLNSPASSGNAFFQLRNGTTNLISFRWVSGVNTVEIVSIGMTYNTGPEGKTLVAWKSGVVYIYHNNQLLHQVNAIINPNNLFFFRSTSSVYRRILGLFLFKEVLSESLRKKLTEV